MLLRLPVGMQINEISSSSNSSLFRKNVKTNPDLSNIVRFQIDLPLKHELVIHLKIKAGFPLF